MGPSGTLAALGTTAGTGAGAGATTEGAGARKGADIEVEKEIALIFLSSPAEKGCCTTATETGRGALLATAGRKTTGAVAARLLMKPGANGRAVRFRTELEGISGSGVGVGAVRVDTAGPAGRVTAGATATSGANDMT